MAESSGDTIRHHFIKTRVSETERGIIFKNADKAKASVSAFIRARAMSDMGQSPRSKRRTILSASEGRSVAITLACMGRLVDIIREYDETLPYPEDIQFVFTHLLREIKENRDRCFTALGKKP
ncbi:hypothetical protein N9W89_00360 [Hellea sp.]|nr:hypothetical protein [Hellea sp.]